MAYISEDQVRKIKESSDIVEVIGSYIDLTRSGRDYKGVCPFHDDHSPSLSVSQEKQIYKCFACGAGGDVITFVMEKDNLTYPEALTLLAKRAGIEIEERKSDPRIKEKYDRLYNLNKEAMMYFYKNFLLEEKVQEYLMNRNIPAKAVNAFMLGYAKAGNNIISHLKAKGFKEEEMLEVGLISKSSTGYYDKYRDRLIFPISNARGKIIGFGGRILGDGNPKYLNSPESLVFKKGDNLYGVNVLKNKKDRKSVILVEGYMDVIGLFCCGIDLACASLGTALTHAQARLVKRYGNDIYICYDGDQAGIRASLKAIEIFEKLDIVPRLILLPDNLDPDEYVHKYGKEAFINQMEKALNPIDYQIQVMRQKYRLENHEEKINYLSEMASFLSRIDRNVVRDEYIKKVSREDRIDEDSLKRDVYSSIDNSVVNTRINFENVSIPLKKGNNIDKLNKVKFDIYVEILKLLLKDEEYLIFFAEELEKVEDLALVKLISYIKNAWMDSNRPLVKNMVDKFDDPIYKEIIDKLALSELRSYSKKELQSIAKEVKNKYEINDKKIQREKLKEELDSLDDKMGNEAFRLMKEIYTIDAYIQKIGGIYE